MAIAGKILGFGAVWRLADSVVLECFGGSTSHLRRLSNGLVSVLPMGKGVFPSDF